VLGHLLSARERDPGSVFCYDQRASYALAAIVQAVTGEPLSHYLHRRLPGVLGPAELAWAQYPAGRDIGYSGLYTTTNVVARLGQLYLGGGAWGGRQLLSRWWVDEATGAQGGHGAGGRRRGLVRVPVPCFPARLPRRWAYGQYCLVLRQQDVVVAITAQTRSPGRPDMQTVLSLVWERLVPAFGAHAVVATEADERLAARLGSLALPSVGGDADPPPDASWAGATFFPSGPGRGDLSARRQALPGTDGPGRAALRGRLRAQGRLGQGTWAVEERTPAGARRPGGL